MSENLTLAEFPPVTTEQWNEVVLKDLKGVPAKVKLFYRDEDLSGLDYLDSAPGEFPFTRGTRANNEWRIRVAASDATAAQAALEAGAEEISLTVGDQNIEVLLKSLPPCDVHIEAGPRAPEILRALVGQASTPAAGLQTRSLDYEPLSDFDEAADLVRKAAFRAITIRAHRFPENGATVTQELALAIAEGVEILTQLTDRGLTTDAAAKTMAFSIAIGPNYFTEIAKLRAARTLWARVVETFHPADPTAAKMIIHARTAHWDKTIYDSYNNVLRATTEAMAAVIGGADTVQVEAFDEPYRAPDAAGIRLARNTQLILKKEAWLDRSVDPAGGSYYLESLTDSLAREAWKLFQQIEAQGGFLKYSESGALEQLLSKSKADREAQVSTRRTAIVGTNQYPNLQEHMLDKLEHPDPAPRQAHIFEQIRLRTENHAKQTGHTPKFLLLESGDLKMRKARSGFAANFFGCAGFEIEISETLTTDADAVVLCSSDPEYPALATRVIAELEAAGKSTPLIVAGNPAESIEQLKQAGVADFIHIRSNAAEVLRTWQDRLGVSR